MYSLCRHSKPALQRFSAGFRAIWMPNYKSTFFQVGRPPVRSLISHTRIEEMLPFKWEAHSANEEIFDSTTSPVKLSENAVMSIFEYDLTWNTLVSSLFKVISVGRFGESLFLIEFIGIDAKDRFGHNVLHAAAKYCQSDLVLFMANLGADVNARNANGVTPLGMAAKFGSYRSILALAALGADLDTRDMHDFTPIHYAAWGGVAGCITALALLGLCVDARAGDSCTPLMHVTTARGARAFIRLGADVNAQEHQGLSVLHCVAQQENTEILKVLVEEGKADLEAVSKTKRTPICLAMHSVEMIATFARLGANVNAIKDHEPPLFMACNQENPGAIVALVQMGADVNARTPTRCSALHFAAAHCGPEIIATLVHLGADIEAFYSFITPLATAAEYGNLDAVLELIRLGANVEGRCKDGQWCDRGFWGVTPLQVAVKEGQEEAARVLVHHGADINKRLNNGNTFLYHILYLTEDHQKSLHSLKLAVQLGADVNAKNTNGEAPIHFAKNKEEVQVLMEAGAYVKVLDEDGDTPLFRAARLNRADVIDVLVRAGVDVHHVNKSGFTALHHACWKENAEAAAMLITHNANVNQRDLKAEFTTLSLGIANPDLVGILVKAGVDVNARIRSGKTVLYAKNIPIESLKLLLQAGISVNSQDKNGNTALHRMISIQNLEGISLLLAAGANIFIPNHNGEVPYFCECPEVQHIFNDHIIATPKDEGF